MAYDGFKTLEDINVTGKRVLLRISADVPLTTNSDGSIEVGDDTRLRAVVPTFQRLLKEQCSIVCCGGWLGRPEGTVDPKLRLDPIAKRLSELLGVEVIKLDDCIGDYVVRAAKQLKSGQIILLENTRFHPEEAANDPKFAASLASLAEVCVFDAFAQSHRNHASTTGIVGLLPTVLGPQMVGELTALQRITNSPEHPFVVVMGGAKITDKISILRTLVSKADSILIGGAVASTFLKAHGTDVGTSKIESADISKVNESPIEMAREITKLVGTKLYLPVDMIAGDSATAPTMTSIVDLIHGTIQSTMGFYDIGPATAELYRPIISAAKTVFWNGLMGVSETPAFRSGTVATASMIAKNKDALTVIGGGDTADALNELHITDQFNHVSTGGGASLVVVSGGELAVLQAMNKGVSKVVS